jgi:Lrp/AsnC family leucine-responsive transcriptional regulator
MPFADVECRIEASIIAQPSNRKENNALGLHPSDLLTDARNVQILSLLREDPRMSVSELARKVGMSAPAIRERVQRLEEAKVIVGYRLEVDAGALGYPIGVFVRIRPAPGKLQKIIELAQRMPQVTECHRITGEDCFILRIYLESLDMLDSILDQFLAYGQTTTSLVQSSPVPPRGLPLPGERRR